MAPQAPLLGRGALRAAVYVGGLIATAAGLDTVVRGVKSLPGEGKLAKPVVESELRFYAAFYAAYGLAALRVAPRADQDTTAVPALAGALFLAGMARIAGWCVAGRPHPAQLALLTFELTTPPLIIASQRRLAAARPRAS
ncbi:MAG: DUF4345 domain-containing protein [Solirubrobacterales bacterium]